MKRAIFLTILLLSVWCSITVSGQSVLEKRADVLYENMSYSKSASVYESLHKRDPENGKFIQRLAYCYGKMLNYKKALLYYSYLVQIDEKQIIDYYDYAQLLRIDGKIEQSKEWLQKYIHLVPDDQRAVKQYEQLDQLISLKEKIKKVEISEVQGNTSYSDMSPVFYNDRLVFSSARDSFSMIRNEFKWNSKPFLSLYVTNPNPQSSFSEVSTFSKKLDTRVHEGPASFSSDFKTVYFTGNSSISESNIKSSDGVNNLKIFISSFDGKEWSEPRNFPFNSNTYSVGHPALTPDDNTMYFISDMQGGFGKTDIYKSEWLNGQWSKPENLGPSINTEGKEMFPTVDKQGILYFSSDGRPGLAGLDIYAAKPDGNGNYLVANFGSPLNSAHDDFGFILNTDSLKGYFTSNRPGGKGDDDIYSFSVIGIDLQVTSKMDSTKAIMPGTKIFLKKENGEIITSAISDKDGIAEFSVKPGEQYWLTSENTTYASDLQPVEVSKELFGLTQMEEVFLKQGYVWLTVEIIDPEMGLILPLAIFDISEGKYDESALEDENGIIRMKLNNSTDYTFYVNAEGFFPNTINYTSKGKTPGEYSLTVEMEKLSTGKQFVLEDLFYDLNKSNIRPDAALVLDDLAQILLENEEVRIEIGSHTDSRSDADYNLKLSQRRSESVVAYLVSKGIAANRLEAKGFGESQLINRCADGVECPEEEHQVNRRTVIEILNKDIRKVKRGSQNIYYF